MLRQKPYCLWKMTRSSAWTLDNRPGVKVLVTTGASRVDLPPEIVEPLLAKPYTGRDLLDRVKQALAKRPDDGDSSA